MAPHEFPPDERPDRHPGARPDPRSLGSPTSAPTGGPTARSSLDRAGAGSGLAVLVAALAADEAAASRARVQWLARQAEEEGTFAGVLADLGDRGRPTLVVLRDGRRHRATVALLGGDFVALRLDGGREVLVPLDEIAAVQTGSREQSTAGDRAVRAELSLAEALALLAGERARLLVVHRGGQASTVGEARACGRDVLTVRLDGGGGTAYLSLVSVSEVSLAESG